MTPFANTPPSELSPVPGAGDVIDGKYRIEEVVGRGGMGVVLAARHLQLGQRVAIKVLHASEATRTEATARFLREGRAAAGLASDHVVRIHDLGMLPSGAAFMVMELLRGRDLSAHLATAGPLPIAEAADFVLQTCDAIAEAHSLGIVHRDLKPSNLFLTQRSDGTPLIKVLDFGISKTRPDPEDPASRVDLTSTRSVIGSPAYMAPEQIRDAKHVDVRVDIWSLGLILYELLSGKQAFVADTLPAVCAAIAADAPTPLQQIRPDVPATLAAIVQRCLEKDPARRFQTVCELGDALAPFGHRPVELKRCPPTAALAGHREAVATPSASPSASPRAPDDTLLSGERERLSSPTSSATLASPTQDEAIAPEPAPSRSRSTPLLLAGLVVAVLVLLVTLALRRGPSPEPVPTASAPAASPATAAPARAPASRPLPEASSVPPGPPSASPTAGGARGPAATTGAARAPAAAPRPRGSADAGDAPVLDIRLER